MIIRRKVSEAEFNQLTEPKLRLFLSADLEHSARLKQTEENSNAIWLSQVLAFYRDFPLRFEADLQARARARNELGIKFPEVWKYLGDEIVFVHELNQGSEVWPLIDSFRTALHAWNDIARQNDRANLRAKGSAWLAGFPVSNAVLENQDGSKDFAGPSIDAEFRLSKLATPRKLALSVEVAWVLLKCDAPVTIHFDGSIQLKGVSEEMGYPDVWIEVGRSEYVRLHRLLMGMGRQSDSTEMLALFSKFIEEFGVPRFTPFIEGDHYISRPNGTYDDELRVTREMLRRYMYSVEDTSEQNFSSDTDAEARELQIKVEADFNKLTLDLPNVLERGLVSFGNFEALLP